jgi:hypothetical protein
MIVFQQLGDELQHREIGALSGWFPVLPPWHISIIIESNLGLNAEIRKRVYFSSAASRDIRILANGRITPQRKQRFTELVSLRASEFQKPFLYQAGSER